MDLFVISAGDNTSSLLEELDDVSIVVCKAKTNDFDIFISSLCIYVFLLLQICLKDVNDLSVKLDATIILLLFFKTLPHLFINRHLN